MPNSNITIERKIRVPEEFVHKYVLDGLARDGYSIPDEAECTWRLDAPGQAEMVVYLPESESCS